MRTRWRARYLAALAAALVLLQLAVVYGITTAGSAARAAPSAGHRRSVPSLPMPAMRWPGILASPPQPRERAQPPRDWAVQGSLIRNLGTAPGSPYKPGEKVAALTFDDGPSPIYTPGVLRVLTAAKAPASFEIVGQQGTVYPAILRAENAAGMALVNHTWTHAGLPLLPARRWPAEVDQTDRLLTSVTGHPVRCLRPPYGLSDLAVTAQLRRRGLAMLGWDVDPSDYLRPGATVIARRVLSALHPGAIVIMHDGGDNRAQTVAALPAIISGIRARGYQIVPACNG